MATESRIPAAFDNLYARLEASTELQEMDCAVWDGPPVTGDNRDGIFLGYDGNPDGEFLAASTTQRNVSIGQRKRDESIAITGCAIVLLGNGTWKEARDRAFALIDIVGQALRTTADDPALGQPPPSFAEFESGDLFQEPLEVGNQARVPFTIRFNTRV